MDGEDVVDLAGSWIAGAIVEGAKVGLGFGERVLVGLDPGHGGRWGIGGRGGLLWASVGDGGRRWAAVGTGRASHPRGGGLVVGSGLMW